MEAGSYPPGGSVASCGGSKVSAGDLSAAVHAGTGLLSFFTSSTDNEPSTILNETARTFSGSASDAYKTFELAGAGAACTTPGSSACCMDLSNWHTEPHSAVALSNCHPASNGLNQQWQWDSVSGLVRVHLNTSNCLARSNQTSRGPAGKSGALGVEVNQCDSSDPNQVWDKESPALEGADGFLLCLKTKATQGGCVAADVEQGGSFKDGTPLAVVPKETIATGDPRQTWTASNITFPPKTQVSFTLADRVLGFGEHQNGQLDSRGLAFDMESCLEYSKSHGGEVCLPYILGWSNATNAPSYGMLWNMPSYGGASFGATTKDLRDSMHLLSQFPPPRGAGEQRTPAQARHHAAALSKGYASPDADTMTWTADGWDQYEIVVIAPDTSAAGSSSSKNTGASTAPLPASSIMQRYGSVVGNAPTMPEWALGYWHSKNRYSTQADFQNAVQGFVSRDIPINIAVIDYMHWKHMGDWTFDPTYWPNPAAMVQNVSAACEQNGLSPEDERCVRIMVSAWPFSAIGSDTYDYIASAGLGVKNSTASQSGGQALPPIQWPDPNCHTPKCWLYDPTHDAARDFYWSRLDAGYYDLGIDIFWLDASEPEIVSGNGPPTGTQYSIGPQNKVGMMFPFWHTQAVQEGLHNEGKMDVVTITRSAWAGQARHAAATWSGDTQSTFESLQVSVPAGLNSQMSGISWWTLDIGGYSGGDPHNEEFNRLIVRWFEFGLTLPIFRQHGQRDTEPWVLANQTSYELVVDLIRARYTLSDYVGSGLNETAATMLPLMRPLAWDFPSDPQTASDPDAAGAYLFGDGLLARPIVHDNVTSVQVYLPKGQDSMTWIDCATGKSFDGGQSVSLAAPLGRLPMLKRSDRADAVDALLASAVQKYPNKALPVSKVCVPGHA